MIDTPHTSPKKGELWLLYEEPVLIVCVDEETAGKPVVHAMRSCGNVLMFNSETWAIFVLSQDAEKIDGTCNTAPNMV